MDFNTLKNYLMKKSGAVEEFPAFEVFKKMVRYY